MNLQLTNVKKSYDCPVIDLEACRFKTGITTGLIGPNGSGKSTLLKIIGGLETGRGNILYNGSLLNDDLMKKMTYINQKPYLLDNTVFNNVAYPLKIRRLPKVEIDTLVWEKLDELEIAHIADRNAKRLSGGESLKVALARGLVFQPSLVLLDEPTANIDPGSIKTVHNVMKRLRNDTAVTLILVSHNLHEIMDLTDELFFLKSGKIIAQGETRQVLFHSDDQYLNGFFKDFIKLF